MFDLDAMRKTVADFQDLLDRTPSEFVHVRLSPDAWTLTEIVGHLVDSASNNHQRFARLRFGNLDSFPGYEAENWVRAQDYDGCDFMTLATLWTSYNALMLHLAENTPVDASRNTWMLDGKPLSMEFLVNDYYRHLTDHTTHYRERLDDVSEQNG